MSTSHALVAKSLIISTITLVASVTLAPSLQADDVHLTNGSVFEQVETSTTETHVIIEMAIGKLTLPLSQVKELRIADTPIAEFRRRHSSLLEDPRSRAANWLQLSRWGLANGLQTQAGQAALFAARLDPSLDGLAPMLNGLGYENLENVGWIPRSDAMRLRGMVLYDGQWMSAEQRSTRIAADRPQAAPERSRAPKDHSDNAVAIASIKLAEKALEQGERSAQRESDRGGVGFGTNRYGVYSGIVLPQHGFASPEAAAAYNEQVQKDISNLVSRPPGSIIPVNTDSKRSSIFSPP